MDSAVGGLPPMHTVDPYATLNFCAYSVIRVTGKVDELMNEHPWKHGRNIAGSVGARQLPIGLPVHPYINLPT